MTIAAMRRVYLVQSDRDAARDLAVDLATRPNSRVRVARGGRVERAKGEGWWLVTLRVRETVRR